MSALLEAVALLLVPGLPLALIALGCVPGQRERLAALTPWAALPALALALAGDVGASVHLHWILLGSAFGLDELNRVFLTFTALLWLGAGVHARGHLRDDPRIGRFNLLWLSTMAGNFGLILARDIGTFYSSFALMTFAAYGLVVHTRSAEALRAGRVYLVMAVIGEALLVAGLLMAASLIDTPLLPSLAQLPPAIAAAERRDLIMGCLWLGFGIKAGLPLLHMWLPLAHPVAPIPASAVLSGAMIKAGLLGWLNTLPLGLVSLPSWSVVIMSVGLLAAFGGALIGIHQRTPKTVLAYSSISQMGLITAGVGAGLHSPALWPLLLPAVALQALHHGLAKGALFLGVAIAHQPGVRRAGWVLWLALALPGLSLAGLMPTGALTKLTFKAALASSTEAPDWWQQLPWLLSLAAVGTTALIARYLWLLREGHTGERAPRSVWLGWALVLGASSLIFVLLPRLGIDADMPSDAADLIALAWPALVGIVVSVIAWRWLHPWRIPSGDLLVAITPALALSARWLGALAVHAERIADKVRARRQRLDDRLKHDDRRTVRLEQLWRREATLCFAALLVVMLLVSLGGW